MPNVREMLGQTDTPKAREYAQRIFRAFEAGSDRAVVEIQRELQVDQDLYHAVWGFLPASMRRQIKEIVDRWKS